MVNEAVLAVVSFINFVVELPVVLVVDVTAATVVLVVGPVVVLVVGPVVVEPGGTAVVLSGVVDMAVDVCRVLLVVTDSAVVDVSVDVIAGVPENNYSSTNNVMMFD